MSSFSSSHLPLCSILKKGNNYVIGLFATLVRFWDMNNSIK